MLSGLLFHLITYLLRGFFILDGIHQLYLHYIFVQIVFHLPISSFPSSTRLQNSFIRRKVCFNFARCSQEPTNLGIAGCTIKLRNSRLYERTTAVAVICHVHCSFSLNQARIKGNLIPYDKLRTEDFTKSY